MTYDEIGNPITFGSKTFEWCGRQLERITDGDNTYVYSYNTDGDRVSKTVNGVKTEYFYNGSILAGQKTGDETLIFMYDNNGDAFGFIYNGEEYYYIKNVQNDIVAIADKNGTIVANYYYDAWGNVTQITGNTALAQTNPLRYRSYYYDSETGYYHLKSRYYSPEVGRFLNADSVISDADKSIHGYNVFAYCFNNPVNLSDEDGNWAIRALVTVVAKVVVNHIRNWVNNKRIDKEIKKSYTQVEATEEINKILESYSHDKNTKVVYSDNNFKIKNSYKVKSRYARQKVCKIVSRTEGIKFNREYGNMSSEWLFHNIAYELHIKRKSTADADIEYTGDCRPYVYIPTKVLEILGSE